LSTAELLAVIPASEMNATLEQALREAAAQRTTLVIAHRLSTVIDANMIIVLEQGQIVQSGTHDELLSQGGRYAELWAMQARESTDC
jgi:ATP-binding cassette subfamily B protein